MQLTQSLTPGIQGDGHSVQPPHQNNSQTSLTVFIKNVTGQSNLNKALTIPTPQHAHKQKTSQHFKVIVELAGTIPL